MDKIIKSSPAKNHHSYPHQKALDNKKSSFQSPQIKTVNAEKISEVVRKSRNHTNNPKYNNFFGTKKFPSGSKNKIIYTNLANHSNNFNANHNNKNFRSLENRGTKYEKNQNLMTISTSNDPRYGVLIAGPDFEKALSKYRLNELPTFKWEALEHEIKKRPKQWYWISTSLLMGIIIYAIIANAIMMAITFLLIGSLGYIFINTRPRIIKIEINPDGIQVDNRFYKHDDIESFWIFYELDDDFKMISLILKNKYSPYVRIPIGQANPLIVREVLLQYHPEKKQELSIVDFLQKAVGF